MADYVFRAGDLPKLDLNVDRGSDCLDPSLQGRGIKAQTAYKIAAGYFTCLCSYDPLEPGVTFMKKCMSNVTFHPVEYIPLFHSTIPVRSCLLREREA